MNMKLAATAAKRGGWFDRQDALAAGYTDDEVHARVRDGRWLRLCRGAYAIPGPDDDSRADWDKAIWQHRMTARAIYHRLGGRAIVSHQSALLLHGVEVSDLDLSRVHLTRVDGFGRSNGSVCQHAARPPVPDSVEVDRVRLTPGARSVVETIRGTQYPVAVSVVDAALRQGIATAEQFADALGLFAGRTGIGTAQRAASFGDARSESVGESRLRVLLADLGLPAPVLQAEIRDVGGRLVARVDFLLEHWGVIVEFDGALKYAGVGAEVLIAEKAREDELRDLGYEVVRAVWADLAQPVELVARIRRAIARSLHRRGPVAGYVATGT
ncbi:type IV toxin-antitoxin system AbiEi family antitoxin domain-containing protein [Kribbella sp. VKM Ac-2568]|uniref:type IV toxin-antitoxin system AbiEi family antitoxin domain-containing protein n=1 Tax=Kribbella sp. VKM Ac-2568 TaxID=2512219 RepID=UPI0010525F35|nr:type IV toxin-antitoxin system AbiEi family antitoxin domain-containing protein [Kribbella sp. VKM Ac-2568]